MFVFYITLFVLVLLLLTSARSVTVMFGAPFLPLEKEVVTRVLDLAKVKKGDIFYDLGSGDGRLVIEAAMRGAMAYGVEISLFRVLQSRLKIRLLGLDNRAKIIHKNLFKTDLSNADIVVMYLLQSTTNLLQPKLETELKSRTRIVSVAFKITGWKPIKIDPKGPRFGPLYLYKK